jgi:hypothetical protein
MYGLLSVFVYMENGKFNRLTWPVSLNADLLWQELLDDQPVLEN